MASRKKISFLSLFSVLVFFVLSVAPVIAEIQKPALTVEIGNWGGEEGDWIDIDGDGSAEYCPPGTDGDYTKCISIPWMGQYIAAVYRYSVGIAAVLAVVMIMVGGFTWLVSGGSPDKIGRAKEFIVSALIGLALALFSYVILYTINPRLVNITSIGIGVTEIERESKILEEFEGCAVRSVNACDQDTRYECVTSYTRCFADLRARPELNDNKVIEELNLCCCCKK